MGSPTYHSPWAGSISFETLIKAYIRLQSKVVSAVRQVASRVSSATPGRFLLLQFQMSQVSQIGQSISNIVAQVMRVINNAVSNQRSQ
jgi:hypothetical protein